MYLKEGQKLVVLLLDGLNFNLGSKNSFYYNPFFYNLFNKHRSLVLERKKTVNPVLTFYSGQDILTHHYLVRDIFTKNQFINSDCLKNIFDNLARHSGRLWLVVSDERLLKLALRDINRSTIHKIGVISDCDKTQLKSHLKKDYKFIDFSTINGKKLNDINPHDILLLLSDSQEINQFKNLIDNPSLRFNKFFVLTDEAGEGYFESIKNNLIKKDFRHILSENKIDYFEQEVQTPKDWQIPAGYQLYLVSINPNYLEFDLPGHLFQDRFKKIEDFIFCYFLNAQFKLIISAKFGAKYLLDHHSSELLPFIIDEKNISQQNFHTPLEKYLRVRCSIADMAPTILNLLQIPQFSEFNGRSLLPYLYPEHHIGEHSDLGHRIFVSSRRSMFE